MRCEILKTAAARILIIALFAAAALSCTPATTPSPLRYRLSNSGHDWTTSGEDEVLEDLRPRYEAYFEDVMSPSSTEEFNLKALRDDLERTPVDRRNYDALNALAIGYFELNHRATTQRGGPRYLGDSFRSAKLLAVPWRAYGLISDAALRDAVLDFFEDATSGEKLGSTATASRLLDVVASLERKEQDPARLERIRSLTQRLSETSANSDQKRDPRARRSAPAVQ